MHQALWTKNFLCASLSNFFLFLTYYYLFVNIPVYMLENLHGTESQAGLSNTVLLVAAILIRPWAGKWMVKLGKHTVLLISLFIFFLASIGYFLVDSIIGIWSLRFFHGIGFGMATAALGALAADIIPDGRKGEGMGYFVLTMNLAIIVGPFLGLTALHHWGAWVMFAISGFCAFASLLSGAFVKSSQLAEQTFPHGSASEKGKPLSGIIEWTTVPISLAGAFFGLIYASILSFVSVYTMERGLTGAGNYFFAVYAAVLLCSRPFTGRWFDRYGANRIIYPAILCFAFGMFLLSKAEDAVAFLLAAALIGLGWGTLYPSFQTIALQSGSSARRGVANATFLSIFDLGIGTGSWLAGYAGAAVGLDAYYQFESFLVLLGLAVYYFLHGRMSGMRKKEEKAAL
ncbi:MFS transporter [Bacillaceae bacterium]